MSEIAVRADLNASVWKIVVAVGDVVSEDQELVILESMKMEIPITAPRAGRVVRILCAEADAITDGQTLMVLEA
jgi:acetyl-CoA carboxylase biotin carboxyl carrier protein